MKKSILSFAIIALTFVACEQPNTENVDYKNPDVYGVWAQDYVDKAGENATSILYINDRNIEFISEDSLRIYHGYWDFTAVSDLGYIEYKYEVIKNEKLILTSYSPFGETNTTNEYLWRPDLSYIEEKLLSNTEILNIKGFLGKWEWVSTYNLDSCYDELKKHIIDTLENSIIEFKTNTFITHPISISKNVYVTEMLPYTAIISKKDACVIDDKVLPFFYTEQQNSTKLEFYFPRYNNGQFTGFMANFGGVGYIYYFTDNKLVLKYNKSHIIFQKME